MQNVITARFISQDRKVAVMGRWHHRGGCLYIGQITVIKSGEVVKRISSTMPRSIEGLADFAA